MYIEDILNQKDPDDKRPVLLMAQDEGRFGRMGNIRRSWTPPGIKPTAASQMVREYFYTYTAVAPSVGKLTSLILPYSNTCMMNIFLKQVSEDFSDYFIIMQVDRAGWHRSKDLEIPENIRLLYQPAYSPELNPVELIWRELKKYLHNKIFMTIDAVINLICEALKNLSLDKDKIITLTNFSHFKIIL